MPIIQIPLPIFDEPCIEIDNLLKRTSIPEDKLDQILHGDDPADHDHSSFMSPTNFMFPPNCVNLRLIDLVRTTSAEELNSFFAELTRTDFLADRLKEQVLTALNPLTLIDYGFRFKDLPAAHEYFFESVFVTASDLNG